MKVISQTPVELKVVFLAEECVILQIRWDSLRMHRRLIGMSDPTPHRNQGAEVTTEARGASVLRASETTVVAISMLRAGGGYEQRRHAEHGGSASSAV